MSGKLSHGPAAAKGVPAVEKLGGRYLGKLCADTYLNHNHADLWAIGAFMDTNSHIILQLTARKTVGMIDPLHPIAAPGQGPKENS